jgi:hypothetical protein
VLINLVLIKKKGVHSVELGVQSVELGIHSGFMLRYTRDKCRVEGPGGT